MGELSDPAGTTHLQSVSFNLASQSDVLLVVYANVYTPQGQFSTLSFKADGVEVDKVDIAGGNTVIGGSILSVATLSHRMTLASGAHTLRLDFPYTGFFSYGIRGGNKPRFYVYQLTGGSGSASSDVNKSADTGWFGPVGNSQTWTIKYNLDSNEIFVTIFGADDSRGNNAIRVNSDTMGASQYGARVQLVDTNRIFVRLANDGYRGLNIANTVPWTGRYMRVFVTKGVGVISATGAHDVSGAPAGSGLDCPFPPPYQCP